MTPNTDTDTDSRRNHEISRGAKKLQELLESLRKSQEAGVSVNKLVERKSKKGLWWLVDAAAKMGSYEEKGFREAC